MNLKQNVALKSFVNSVPSAVPLAATRAPTEQHEKYLHSLQLKYDTMLYIIELIASFHQLDSRNPNQAKAMEDVQSLVAQTRKEIYDAQKDTRKLSEAIT